MDVFAQKRMLVWLVVLLLLLNVCCISVFLWKAGTTRSGTPPRPDDNERADGGRPPRPEDGKQDVGLVLQQELGLSSKQVVLVSDLRVRYFEKEKALGGVIRNERDSMNVAMFNDHADDSLLTALATRIAANEYLMERLRIDQAAELRGICTPAQLAQFNKLVLEIRDYFRPDNRPGKRLD